MLPGPERSADRAREVRPHAVLELTSERALDAFPRRGPGKERLADVKTHAVVVRVQEPGWDIVALSVVGVHRDRIEDVEAEQLNPILVVFGLSDAHVRQPADGEDLA